jgi:hypothetical protein
MSVHATATDLSTLPTVSDKLNVMASIHNRKLISAAIQSRQNPLKGATIQYIYTDSKHNNPLCRVTPIENIQSLPQYDKEKYKEMVLDAAETVLGFFGFDRSAYSDIKKGRRNKWYEELEQKARDIETEML